jgi:hypothetical protein
VDQTCRPGKTVIEEGAAMPLKIDDLLPSAKDIQKQAALKEAEKAGENSRRRAAAEAEKRALIEKLSKPSGLSEEEKVKLAYLQQHGKPVAFYSDKHSIFRVSREDAGGDGMTQFGHALSELNIEILCANVPRSSRAAWYSAARTTSFRDPLACGLRM